MFFLGKNAHSPSWSYLDVDEIVAGACEAVPQPRTKRLCPQLSTVLRSPFFSTHGTVVAWSKCDGLSSSRLSVLLPRLLREIGQTFRYALWNGKRVTLNGTQVEPHDPLFLRRGTNLVGARPYGPEIDYEVRLGISPTSLTSKVVVRFSELPVEEWRTLSNAEKRRQGISKNAGVSILRAGREIDYGWYFMGGKRKENYDDWWRCEIEFLPQLDDLFGVTHTKQGINPNERILSLLCPDLEQIAHMLNSNVRSRFMKLKQDRATTVERVASAKNVQFEPPEQVTGSRSTRFSSCSGAMEPGEGFRIRGLDYALRVRDLPSRDFFSYHLDGSCLTVTLNKQHPFFDSMCLPLQEHSIINPKSLRRQLELLILAAARAEVGTADDGRTTLGQFRLAWSDLLAAFLS